MNILQRRLLNELKVFMDEMQMWKMDKELEINQICEKLEEIVQKTGQKRGPVPGLADIKKRLEKLESDLGL
jgi:hypothetical protein